VLALLTLSAPGHKFGDVLLCSIQRQWPRQPAENALKILTGELPFEWFRGFLVMGLESKKVALKQCEVGKVVWSENPALDDGEVDLDLVEPAGMDGRMNQNGVGIPVAKPLDGALPAMRGAVIRDPEHPPRRGIRFPAHHVIDQVMEGVDPIARTAKTEDLGSTHIPCGKIRQGPPSYVLMLDAAGTAGTRRHGGGDPLACLDAGLLVGADDVVVWAQWLALPDAMIQVQDHSRLPFEIRIARMDPAPIAPRSNGIGGKPAPYGGSADRSDYAACDGLSGNIFTREGGKRQAKVTRHLAGQRLDLHHDVRGKKDAGVRALAFRRDRPGAPRRNACATWQRSAVADQAAVRCVCCPIPQKQGGRPWRA